MQQLDTSLANAIVSMYNDALAEWQDEGGGRLFPQAVLPFPAHDAGKAQHFAVAMFAQHGGMHRLRGDAQMRGQQHAEPRGVQDSPRSDHPFARQCPVRYHKEPAQRDSRRRGAG